MTRMKLDEIPDNIADKMSDEDKKDLGIYDGRPKQKEATFEEPTLYVGIDPGTNTGLSVYDPDKEKLLAVKSGTFIEMGVELLQWHGDHDVWVRIEDARQRKWFGKRSAAKMQGAGSIKRDCKLWEEFCEYYDINYEMVHPIKGATKLDADTFAKMTGWEGQTNEHKRDSAMLVYKLN